MSRINIVVVWLLLVVTGWGQALEVRTVARTNDITDTRTKQSFGWYQGEKVVYTVRVLNGTNSVYIPATAMPIWYVTDSSLTNYFVWVTGTVVEASSGRLRFELPAAYSALPEGLYESAAVIYDGLPDDTPPTLVADRTQNRVLWSPSYSGLYVGPIPSSSEIVLDASTVALVPFWAQYADDIRETLGIDEDAFNALSANNQMTSNSLRSSVTTAQSRADDAYALGLAVGAGASNLTFNAWRTASNAAADAVQARADSSNLLYGAAYIPDVLEPTALYYQLGDVWDEAPYIWTTESDGTYIRTWGHDTVYTPGIISLKSRVEPTLSPDIGIEMVLGKDLSTNAVVFSIPVNADYSTNGGDFVIEWDDDQQYTQAGRLIIGRQYKFGPSLADFGNVVIKGDGSQITGFDLSTGVNPPSAWTAQPSLLALSNAQSATESKASYASNRANFAYALADQPDVDSTAREWAQAGSNLAMSASIAAGYPDTDAVARAWVVASSNLALLAQGYAGSNAVLIAAETAARIAADAASSSTVSTLSTRYTGTSNKLDVLSLSLASVSSKVDEAYGWGNHATNRYAVNGQNITGRWYASGNSVGGQFAVISGGTNNSAGGYGSFVGGGLGNNAGGYEATIGGGHYNTSTGFASTVGGGYQNIASRDFATIPGGYNNFAGQYAFAAGLGARATNDGSFVWSGPGQVDSLFGSYGPNTFNIRSVGGAFILVPFLRLMDTNGVQWAYLSPTGGLQIGAASFHAEPSGDIWHDPTNTAVLGILSATSIKNTNGTSVLYVGEAPTTAAFLSLSSRVASAESGIASLTGTVASQSAALLGTSNNLASLISSEASARIGADSSLSSSVASVSGQLVATSNALAASLSSETQARIGLGTSLSGTVAAVDLRLTTSSNTLYTLITGVDQARIGMGASLSGQVASASSIASQALTTAYAPTDAVARASALAQGVVASNALALASATDTDVTARAWASAASNLALSASQSSTDSTARAYAVAASNLALSASRSSTDTTARVSIANLQSVFDSTSNLFAQADADTSAAMIAADAELSNSVSALTLSFEENTNTVAGQIAAELDGRVGADAALSNLIAAVEAANLALGYIVSNSVDAARLGGSLPASFFLLSDFQSEMTNRVRMVSGIESNSAPGGYAWVQLVPKGGGTNELWVYGDHALGTNTPGWAIFDGRTP